MFSRPTNQPTCTLNRQSPGPGPGPIRPIDRPGYILSTYRLASSIRQITTVIALDPATTSRSVWFIAQRCQTCIVIVLFDRCQRPIEHAIIQDPAHWSLLGGAVHSTKAYVAYSITATY